jgi:diguanylate cyclase (GGDEF)-like protein
MKLAVDDSLSGWCLTAGLPQISNDINLDPRVNLAACQAIGIQSMALMPLKHFDNVVGVLKVMAKNTNHFTGEHQAILVLMCEQIAAAMYFSSRFGDDSLLHAATHDQMTQLANRALFMEKLRALLYVNMAPTAVLIIDMNDLKQLNDQFGHRHGDAVLAELARRLKAAVRPEDLVARLGGDEFGIILSHQPSAQDCQRVCQRINELLAPRFEVDGLPHQISASMGFAIYPDDATHIDQLLDVADQRMYADKRQFYAQPIA